MGTHRERHLVLRICQVSQSAVVVRSVDVTQRVHLLKVSEDVKRCHGLRLLCSCRPQSTPHQLTPVVGS
jgi:hypothetical protein